MVVLLFAMLAPSETLFGGASIEGHWRNRSGSVVVAIAPCGEDLCGRVEWASDKAQADARKGGTDPLIGVELLSSFKPVSEGRWKGHVFVPDVNKRSKAELRQVAPNQLKVSGCVIGRLLCRSELWTRTEEH